jgi:hypothetical protein
MLMVAQNVKIFAVCKGTQGPITFLSRVRQYFSFKTQKNSVSNLTVSSVMIHFNIIS